MNRITVLSLLVVLATPTVAAAQEGNSDTVSAPGARGLGALVEASFVVPNGTGGSAGLVYDAGAFRIGGGLSLALVENRDTNFGIGLNAYYALHRTKSADFSIGGGIGLNYMDPGPGSGSVRVIFEGGAQIRAFVVPNVALLATLGLGLSVGDGGFAFGLGGRLAGSFGVCYFF